MKYLENENFFGNDDPALEGLEPKEMVEIKLSQVEESLAALAQDAPTSERRALELERGHLLVELERNTEAETDARELFRAALADQDWTAAAEACDIIYKAEGEDAVKALAHGIWLSVTFPVSPELTVALLQHLIDETPDQSDGAAVAAATAAYVADLRANDGKQKEDLRFFTTQLLGQVARRHSQVEDQEIFDFWVERLELDDPNQFLPRLAKVLDVLVDDWWFDRDQLRELIPSD